MVENIIQTTSKFGRNYLLSVEGNSHSGKEFYSFQMPLTLEFEITRTMFSGVNEGKFRIYNLSEKTRNNLFHLRFDTDLKNAQSIRLFAGYDSQGTSPMIFFGNIRYCTTMRHKTDWITDIDAWDGGLGMMLGQISLSKETAKWSAEEIFKTLTGTMPFVQYGATGNINIKRSRGVSMVGNSWDIARRLLGAHCLRFIDNGLSFAINENEYLVRPGAVLLIVGPKNIIGTPRINAGILEVDIIFEPSLFVAQAVQVTSLNSICNGTYQLRGFKHSGTISGSVCGKAITTLYLYTGILGLAGIPYNAKLNPVNVK
jgi:hypothetical protein